MCDCTISTIDLCPFTELFLCIFLLDKYYKTLYVFMTAASGETDKTATDYDMSKRLKRIFQSKNLREAREKAEATNVACKKATKKMKQCKANQRNLRNRLKMKRPRILK